jgi:hypothetical protein
MPTIGQLPSLVTVDPADEVPISHGGATRAMSLGTLLSGVQPAILTPTGKLLGRESLGPGGPEPIGIGVGLGLQSSSLVATGGDHAGFPSQTVLEPSDQAVLSSSGSPQLLELSLLRGLFSAGSNITIDSAGTISASGSATSIGGGNTSYTIADLPVATTISSGDLVGISQGGNAGAITYQNFLDGLTINEAQAAAVASNSDSMWVAQGSDTMVCQTFSAIWAWIASNQPSYKYPVVEINTNTTLDGTVHNGRVLVCSQSVTLTPVFGNMGSGFTCSVINLSGANVNFGTGIVSSAGTSVLSAGLSCTLQGVTYSGGSVIYASISSSGIEGAQTILSAVTGIAVTAVSSNAISLTWNLPGSGGTVTSYTVQYQTIGATYWTTASSAVVGTTYRVSGLQSSTTYNIVVFGSNSAGPGPVSSAITESTAVVAGVVPGQITGLSASTSASSSVSLIWSAPSVGTTPITYTIDYRQTGTTSWVASASGVSSTSANVIGLSSGTSYDFKIFASNTSGAGIPSAVVSQSTAASGTSVTAITWNVSPSGSYTHGNGSIGVNAHVTPLSAAVQFGFSTSPTIPPSGWTPGSYVNSDLWGAYVNTPGTAGAWYAWVEGADSTMPTVDATAFTVT